MYTVLLAAMLTGGADQAQAWHWRASCHGCSGCFGSCHGGTVSSHGCGGCSGCAGCFGCSGGSGHGIFGHGCSGGGLFGRGNGLFSRHHGCGGCYGCNGFTGYSVGYSSWASGCYGSSCFGGCYGGAVVPPAGAAPPATPMPGETPPATGDKAPAPGDKVAPPTAPQPKLPDIPMDLPKIEPPKGTEISTVNPNQARVIVHLPVDAKLWVDQVACPISGPTRAFNTPALTPGAQYAYTLTVELPGGAREDRRITMTAGGTVEVEFRGTGIETVRR